MRALTIRQPWAWCVVRLGKVENRTQLWTYRGPLVIHAGVADAIVPDTPQGHLARQAAADVADRTRRGEQPTAAAHGAALAICELVDAHRGDPDGGCCPPWGEPAFVDCFGRERTGVVHLRFADMHELDEPVPMRGRLGLWHPTVDERDAVLRAIR